MSTILEAVKAVPHDMRCATKAFRSEPAGDGRPAVNIYETCDCDRDERIAKGIEAAMKVMHEQGEQNGLADSHGQAYDSIESLAGAAVFALEAFTKAAAL